MQAEALQAAVQRNLKRLRESCANQRARRAQLLSLFKQLVPSNTPEPPLLAYHGTQGPGSGPENEKQGNAARSALRHAKRQRAATPASSSISAASVGSDSAATGVSEGMSSDMLRVGAQAYPAPSEAVCALYITTACCCPGLLPSLFTMCLACAGRGHRGGI